MERSFSIPETHGNHANYNGFRAKSVLYVSAEADFYGICRNGLTFSKKCYILNERRNAMKREHRIRSNKDGKR